MKSSLLRTSFFKWQTTFTKLLLLTWILSTPFVLTSNDMGYSTKEEWPCWNQSWMPSWLKKKIVLKEFVALTTPRQTEEWMMLSLINVHCVCLLLWFFKKNTFMILLKKLGKLTFIYCFNLLCIKNCFFDKWVWRLSNFVWSLLFLRKKNVLFSFITASVFQILKSQFEDCKERVKTFERMWCFDKNSLLVGFWLWFLL